jgi:tetratricopeptide (TPR) repeat protein
VVKRQGWAIAGAILLCLLIAADPAGAKNPQAKQAKEEVEFGYKAARRGYWQEALERFELANELTPNQPRILNNIAVALEANGRFDEARVTYEAGLALDPQDSALQRNYTRFQEFYAAFVAEEEDRGDGADDEDTEQDDES